MRCSTRRARSTMLLERKKLYAEAQQQIVTDLPMVPLIFGAEYAAMRGRGDMGSSGFRMRSRASAICGRPRPERGGGYGILCGWAESGVKVSRIGLGAMGFGDRSWRSWVLDLDQSRAVFRRAIERASTSSIPATITRRG